MVMATGTIAEGGYIMHHESHWIPERKRELNELRSALIADLSLLDEQADALQHLHGLVKSLSSQTESAHAETGDLLNDVSSILESSWPLHIPQLIFATSELVELLTHARDCLALLSKDIRKAVTVTLGTRAEINRCDRQTRSLLSHIQTHREACQRAMCNAEIEMATLRSAISRIAALYSLEPQ
ncbi:conserved protein of unknown function [Paraburkholderia dioscoreae]|uniref:Uncharacterized protein n=2 Tax=Burkholderiaceae TaxID=119060 RepID=A0A5Q4ZVP6_9BURK|nr:conserved protein of unknown function [Paraburkholderia dioscoreae]